MYRRFLSWKQSCRGATAIEYGLIVGGISVTLMATISVMGDDLLSIFTSISDYFASRL